MPGVCSHPSGRGSPVCGRGASVPELWAPWGKASGERVPHPLVCHVLDTAAVAELLLPVLLSPSTLAELRSAFSSLGDEDGWIALFCGLHDLGKFGVGFQALRADVVARRFDGVAVEDVRHLERPKGIPRVDTPHGTVTALHLGGMLRGWGMRARDAVRIATALGGHHGYFPDSSQVGQAGDEVNDHGGVRWAGWRDELVLATARVWGLPEPEALPWSLVRFGPVAGVGLAAVTAVSDWIASDVRNYVSPEGAFDIVGYAARAREQARKAVATARLVRWSAPSDTSFAALFPDDTDQRPAQQVAERLVAGMSEPAVFVVEAPTGEGKTKLALQVASTLVRSLGLGGIYVGMPTKATSHQFLEVVEGLLVRLGDPATVKLVHSDARAYLEERAVEPREVGRDDPLDSDEAAGEWFTRKKSLLAPLGVGTVDQALRSVVRSGHVFVRLAALSNKVVVFDEVHAYNTQMSALLDRLLMWLGRLGTSVVVLSATLPSHRRQDLVAAWQAGRLDRAPSGVPRGGSDAVYPQITVAQADPPKVVGVAASELNENRVVVLDKEVTDDTIVDWLVERARGGRGVAVVHNLVARATATYDGVRAAVERLPESERPDVELLHGQLATRRRSEVEGRLRRWFGAGGTRRHAIVIGTQVLEQSLDLDFDAMATDLAPVDLIVQRAGRVHRHTRDGRGDLVLGVIGVEDTDDGPRFPRYLHSVYALHVLARTWALLKDRPAITCPQDVPGLVDAVYGPHEAVACPPGWEALWERTAEAYRSAIATAQDQAKQWYVPMPAAVERLTELTGVAQRIGSVRGGRSRRD
ncbi:CRISPR-associated helicase Cas3' [Actinosynnema sp. NPDC020468]|uniref:CRISPR-associated helicase Cas3' n=1 Tax=Actinosynnema sp. NPDC020468 TaxID=3154488 RepID=UPI0033CA426D